MIRKSVCKKLITKLIKYIYEFVCLRIETIQGIINHLNEGEIRDKYLCHFQWWIKWSVLVNSISNPSIFYRSWGRWEREFGGATVMKPSDWINSCRSMILQKRIRSWNTETLMKVIANTPWNLATLNTKILSFIC